MTHPNAPSTERLRELAFKEPWTDPVYRNEGTELAIEVLRLRDKLDSCAALLETMAESADARGDVAEFAMMSVMAKDARRALNGGTSDAE